MLEFTFQARVWRYEGPSPWHFVTLPIAVAKQIQAGTTKAFGTVKVVATVGETRWNTSLFRDNQRDSYLLPIKGAVRRKEQIQAGAIVEVLLVI